MIIVHILILIIFIVLIILSGHEECTGKGIEKPFKKIAAFLVKRRRVSAANAINKKLALLNPAGNLSEIIRDYYVNKLFQVLLVLFIGNLLGLFYALSNVGADGIMDNRELKRPGYGEGERQVELRIFADGEPLKDDMELTVGEIQYTEEEVLRLFNEIEASLETLILGENESLDYVDRDLKLITRDRLGA